MLERLGLPPKFLTLITHLYDGAKIQLRFDDGTLSDPFDLLNGLTQGGVIPPLLFNIYVAAILAAAHKEFLRCGIQTGIRASTAGSPDARST